MTINVVCRKDAINRNNLAPLALVFTHDRRRKFVGLGMSVLLEHWDFEKQQSTPDCPDRAEIQFQIISKIREYEKKIKKLEVLEIPVTFDNLFEQNGKRINCTVGDYFRQIIERLEKVEKYGSASKHKVTLALMSQFRSVNMRFEEVDLTYLREFEIFLRQRGNVNNSLATKFSVLKAVYNKAVSEGVFIPKSNPFQQFKVGSLWTNTRKRAITKEDIHKLIELDLSERDFYTQLAKDIFLFSYFMAGVNFKDIALLTYADIDNGRIYYARRKTGKAMNCCLTEQAQEIIDKYRTDQLDEDISFARQPRTAAPHGNPDRSIKRQRRYCLGNSTDSALRRRNYVAADAADATPLLLLGYADSREAFWADKGIFTAVGRFAGAVRKSVRPRKRVGRFRRSLRATSGNRPPGNGSPPFRTKSAAWR